MGKKGFNWKSRQVIKTLVDDTKTKKVVIRLILYVID